ncbi:hypothetical protein [Burkholderia ubonensis]|uniref:hypothetical protein n=1 Tax=Burkholderia ubonensis TaxID=101571 RepID=UPI0009B41B72|nr:hypothetical protein [Burkholderia ubonensis]
MLIQKFHPAMRLGQQPVLAVSGNPLFSRQGHPCRRSSYQQRSDLTRGDGVAFARRLSFNDSDSLPEENGSILSRISVTDPLLSFKLILPMHAAQRLPSLSI